MAARPAALNVVVSTSTRCPPCSSVRANPGCSTSTNSTPFARGRSPSTADVTVELRALSPVMTTTLWARRIVCRSGYSLAPSPAAVRTRGVVIVASAAGSGSTTTTGRHHRLGCGAGRVSRSTAARGLAPNTTRCGHVNHRPSQALTFPGNSPAIVRTTTRAARKAATLRYAGGAVPSGTSRFRVNSRNVW